MFNRFLAILTILICVIGFTAQARAAESPIHRIAGETRFETAKAIAETLNSATSENIVVVSGHDIKNALSASTLAHKLNAPILLADETVERSTDLYDYANQHLAHNGNVYFIGGADLAWGDFIQRFQSVSVQQIEGSDCFETSALVAQYLDSGQGGTVVICAGEDYSDTLSISSIAAYNNWPILFVDRDVVPGSVNDFLQNKKPDTIYIMGGRAMVSYNLESQLHKLFPKTTFERFQGIDRFDTSAKILNRFAPNPKNVYLASSNEYAQALVGSALAAKTGDPLLLTDSESIDLPLALRNYMVGLKNTPSVYVLGDEVAVSSETASSLWNITPIQLKNTDFVEIQQMIPSVDLDIKYATVENFTHTKLYDSSKALLRKGTAEKLKKVADEVEKKGYRLKIWDAYRSPEAQFKLWKLVPDSRYVANPNRGYSNHSRGSAVDLTLVDLQGNEISMPTGFDNFTAAAARTHNNANAKYLEKVMMKYGFKPLATEWWHFDDKDTYQPEDSAQVPPPPKVRKSKIAFTLSAVGDITLGQDERFPYEGSFNQYYSKYGRGYFFTGVKKILSEDDLTVANLEGTLTEATEKPDKSFQGNQAFFFKGNPAYTAILKDGSIEAVSIANNHSMDYLKKGFTDTVAALDDAGVISFGDSKIAIYEKNGIKIGLVGVNPLGPLEEGIELQKLKSDLAVNLEGLKEKTSLIVVSFHWGTENKSTPTQEQRELGRFAIDQGADLVLGHHPHVIQPNEVYQGKWIVYSLGNFVFGGNSNPWYKNTEIFRQKYTFINGKLVGISSPMIIPCRLSLSYKPEPIP